MGNGFLIRSFMIYTNYKSQSACSMLFVSSLTVVGCDHVNSRAILTEVDLKNFDSHSIEALAVSISFHGK